MKTHACFQYQFNQVGQGQFASGCVYQSATPTPKFLWVYDCGSVSSHSQNFWHSEVRKLKDFVNLKPEIDLLVLSHFDDDHISGVPELLNQFDVKTLLLPYVPLWRRLLIGFDEGSHLDEKRMSRYIDPIGYLNGLGTIGQIIIVPPSEGEILPVDGWRPEGLPEDGWKARFPMADQKAGLEISAEFRGTGSTSQLPLMLTENQAITLEGLWEFCTYNTARYKMDSAFALKVNELREELLKTSTERTSALKALKEVYDRQFGSNDRPRNEISLFLYAGPVYESWNGTKMLDHNTNSIDYPSRLPCYYRCHPTAPGITDKCSILYSGDGYLNSNKSFAELYQRMGQKRMEKLGIFQVNHHGSRTNWRSGLGSKINAVLAVFSSDPSRQNTNHPNPEVWADFSCSQRIQVNADPSPFTTGGWMVL
ncbi:MBL fold metallo-hydrolase [Prosthecobacter fusiformis]